MISIPAVFAAAAMILVPVYRDYGQYGYVEAKNELLVTLAAAAAAVILVSGSASVPISLPAYLLLGWLLYTSVSLVWADAPQMALPELARWWALGALYFVCAALPQTGILAALYLPAPFVACHGIIQAVWNRDPLDPVVDKKIRDERTHLLWGLIGNPNHTAAYLVPMALLGTHLAVTHHLWILASVAPIVGALILTRCRAAIAALAIGLAAVSLWLAPAILGACAGTILLLSRKNGIASWRHRWLLIRMGLELCRRRLLFGWGPAAYRRKHAHALADLNRRDPTIMGTRETPGRYAAWSGRRVHCDWVEFLVDGGIIGAAGFVAFFAATVAAAWDGPPLLAAALIAFGVNGLFFYPFRTVGTALPGFVLAAAVAPERLASLEIPIAAGIPAACACLYLGWRLGVLPAVARYYAVRGDIMRAIRFAPCDNRYLTTAAELWSDKANRHDVAIGMVLRALQHFDGEVTEWSLHRRSAEIYFNLGCILLADAHLKMAMALNPADPFTHRRIDEMQRILKEREHVLRRGHMQPGACPTG